MPTLLWSYYCTICFHQVPSLSGALVYLMCFLNQVHAHSRPPVGAPGLLKFFSENCVYIDVCLIVCMHVCMHGFPHPREQNFIS